MIKKIVFIIFTGLISIHSEAQKLLTFKLPDTGQYTSYTSTQGEDADFVINPLSFTDNGNGTITDNNTGLMWQEIDGGEMTIENAITYCDTLTRGGYSDWRLPIGIELFSINKYSANNPALDTVYFKKTQAEYWWTSERQVDDATKVWVVNAGGGIGAHPKTETVSAGGTKKFHVRAVRNIFSTTFSVPHFTDNGDGTIKDNFTGLTWQKIQSPDTLSWENALIYASGLSLGGKHDWRLPDVKELQSLNDISRHNPSVNTTCFTSISSGKYWTSTTLLQPTPVKAWTWDVAYGIVSYNEKTSRQNVLCVRGGMDNAYLNINEALIPAGQDSMGDHFNFVDPHHNSDEKPIHLVYVDSFFISKTEMTNQQYLAFLNSSLHDGIIHVSNNRVYLTGDTNTLCLTHQLASFYSISYDGNVFSIADFREYHPMVGVMWSGAVAFCNWLSRQNGLDECYNLSTWDCDFAKNGYRLPTEAEWEWAGRGGHTNPYLQYEKGDTAVDSQANLPNSGDPYESANTALYPLTTPVGFYDGALKLKSDFNWPGSATQYQTSNGINGYGLVDMQGNAWEFVNDWYGQDYYSSSPYNNPTGPASGFLMPDGKPYRGMRGGNWYNGDMVNGIDDGHSRVSNRNPSYFRGPQDPNHPWYHVGFRVARKYSESPAGINDNNGYGTDGTRLFQNYPNPFSTVTTIQFELPESSYVSLKVFNIFGQVVANLENDNLNKGIYKYQWNADHCQEGIYTYQLIVNRQVFSKKMLLIK